MDLRSLKIFIEVAEQASFTRAGEQLGYSQPTISFQIRQLEQELAFLFLTGLDTRSVSPMRAGGPFTMPSRSAICRRK